MSKSHLSRSFAIWVLFLLAARVYGQGPLPADPDSPGPSEASADMEPAPERWNLYYQATSIGDYHGKFHSPYEDATSLQDHTRARRLADNNPVFHAGGWSRIRF